MYRQSVGIPHIYWIIFEVYQLIAVVRIRLRTVKAQVIALVINRKR